MRPFALWSVLFLGVAIADAQDSAPHLELLNTQRHDVVIGLYTPLNGGIEEFLIAAPAQTSIQKIPIPDIVNDQFVVAYQAVSIDGKIVRAKPLKILGMGALKIVRDEQSPFAVLRYRGEASELKKLGPTFDTADTEDWAKTIKEEYRVEKTIIWDSQ